MTYAVDLSAQISATRELAQRVRDVAALISLNTDRARLLDQAEELERYADEQERLQASQLKRPALHLAAVSR
jgi:hypothetical protein